MLKYDYIEVDKPKTLPKKTKLYYMYSNSHDSLGVTYAEITSNEVLDIAYRVYKRVTKENIK